MPKYQLKYASEQRYDSPVHGAFYKFLVHPFLIESVTVLNTNFLASVPGDFWTGVGADPAKVELYFSSAANFREVEIEFSCEVEVPEYQFPDFDQLSFEEESNVRNSKEWLTENYSNLFIYVGRKSALSKATASEFNWDLSEKLAANVLGISKQVHQFLKFEINSTDTATTAEEVFLLKKGVCQDFVHLMLGILRNYQVSCRYVSGYLHPGEGKRGALQLHAWVEVNFPLIGWIGIDPTNQLFADHHYIKICHGYDYDDCLPLAGVVNTNAGLQETNYQVEVKALNQNQ